VFIPSLCSHKHTSSPPPRSSQPFPCFPLRDPVVLPMLFYARRLLLQAPPTDVKAFILTLIFEIVLGSFLGPPPPQTFLHFHAPPVNFVETQKSGLSFSFNGAFFPPSSPFPPFFHRTTPTKIDSSPPFLSHIFFFRMFPTGTFFPHLPAVCFFL